MAKMSVKDIASSTAAQTYMTPMLLQQSRLWEVSMVQKNGEWLEYSEIMRAHWGDELCIHILPGSKLRQSKFAIKHYQWKLRHFNCWASVDAQK